MSRIGRAHGLRLLWYVGMMVWLSGCAGWSGVSQYQLPPSAPSKVIIESVPFYAQQKYQCGPAALAMALNWSGVALKPDDLVDEVYTPERKGALQVDLITATRQHRRLAYPFTGLPSLLQEVAAGHPVIVLQNLGLGWWPRWHYAVVVGYDWANKHIVLHSGRDAFKSLHLGTFLHTWRRADQWALLVLPVESLPISAQLPTYLKAAFGLQHIGHLDVATQAFQRASQQWPESKEAWIGLGNALYSHGDGLAAADAFQKAIEIDPACGDAHNNLAHLLAEQGELERAEQLARRAIMLGGPRVDLYQRTLKEILKNKPH